MKNTVVLFRFYSHTGCGFVQVQIDVVDRLDGLILQKNQIAKMPNRTSRVRMQIGMQNGYTSAHICTSLVRCLLESLLQLNFFSFI